MRMNGGGRTGGPWRAMLPPAALTFAFYCCAGRAPSAPDQLLLGDVLLPAALASVILSFAFFRRNQTACVLCAALYLLVQAAQNGRAMAALWGSPRPWPYLEYAVVRTLLIFVALGVLLRALCPNREWLGWIALGAACIGAGLTAALMIEDFGWLRFSPACRFFEFLVPVSGFLWESFRRTARLR